MPPTSGTLPALSQAQLPVACAAFKKDDVLQIGSLEHTLTSAALRLSALLLQLSRTFSRCVHSLHGLCAQLRGSAVPAQSHLLSRVLSVIR